MAAVAGFNNTSGNDLVHTEGINKVILAANITPHIFDLLGWIIDASKNGSPTHRIPRWDDTSVPSGTKTETDEADWTSFPTSKADVTAGVVIVRSLLSDEHAQDANATPESSLQRQIIALTKRMDEDVLGLGSSLTNITDETGNALTLDIWEAARTAYLGQKPMLGPGGFHAFVGTSKIVGKMQTLLRQAGGGSLIQGAGLMMFDGQPMAEYQGRYQGFEIFQGAAPAADVSNSISMFLCAGEHGALAMGVWWGLRPGSMPVLGRTGTELVTSARYGVTPSNQANARALKTLK